MPLDRRSFLVAAGSTAAAAGILLASDIAVAGPLKAHAGKVTVAAGHIEEAFARYGHNTLGNIIVRIG